MTFLFQIDNKLTFELMEKKSSNYLDEVEVFGDQFLAVVHDENTSDIQFDIVLLFLVFKQIEGRPLGDKQKCTEFELSFNAEVRKKIVNSMKFNFQYKGRLSKVPNFKFQESSGKKLKFLKVNQS